MARVLKMQFKILKEELGMPRTTRNEVSLIWFLVRLAHLST
jgi:hypothetical protein